MNRTPAFSKVLIANRGEIALRVLRALKSMGIPSVAIYHHSDRNSPAVRQADEAVEIFGDNPSAAHLDSGQIIDLCRHLGVDAVHPGYGFLSENSSFARTLASAGITFIGPPENVIELMGDKITSRNFVESLGVPVAPSASLDTKYLDHKSEQGTKFLAQVASMEFPLIIKASAGGGGKGMSIVHSVDELQSMLRIAASEAEKYFGDHRVYVERYFASARHIEVQILGDGENIIHLGERECSVQRRFQKLIEEAPSPAFGSDTSLANTKRAQICEAAKAIAIAAKYSSAGTVEFLYTPEGEFFFLEMNTRIQVEHPVTEMVYGVDLVVEQIKIASGQKLAIRQENVVANGHAIECRLCAEDAFNDFIPETGKVLYIKEPSATNIRFDSGLYQNQVVTTAFDPMLAKLVCHGATRRAAISRLIAALRELVVLGVRINTEYLVKILEHPAFTEGDIDTGFVKTHATELVADSATIEQQQRILAAAYMSDRNTKLLMATTPEPYAAIGNWRN